MDDSFAVISATAVSGTFAETVLPTVPPALPGQAWLSFEMTTGAELLTLDVIPMIGDIDHDGVVGPADLADLIAAWGQCPGGADLPPCPADLNHDGVVGPADMAQLLAHWSDSQS
jgi:hypothetical protein